MTVGAQPRYDVELRGVEGTKASFASSLQQVFGIEPFLAQQIAHRTPVIVKHNVPWDDAKRFVDALRQAGGEAVALPRTVVSLGLDVDVPQPPDLQREESLAHRTSLPVPASPGEGSAPESEREEVPFFRVLLGAFAYPFQRDGSYILPSLAVLTFLITALAVLLTVIPVVGFILYLAIYLALVGFSLAYLALVVNASALGKERLPIFDDSDPWSWYSAAFRYLMAMVVPFLPVVVSIFVFGDEMWIVTALLAAVGLLLYPATLILAAIDHGTLGPLNLPAAYTLVTRVPKGYLTLFFGMSLVGASSVAMSSLLDVVLADGIIPGALFAIFRLYVGVVMARMLGLFLFHHDEELGLV